VEAERTVVIMVYASFGRGLVRLRVATERAAVNYR
jgi:hypothetical protein